MRQIRGERREAVGRSMRFSGNGELQDELDISKLDPMPFLDQREGLVYGLEFRSFQPLHTS